MISKSEILNINIGSKYYSLRLKITPNKPKASKMLQFHSIIVIDTKRCSAYITPIHTYIYDKQGNDFMVYENDILYGKLCYIYLAVFPTSWLLHYNL